MDDLQYSDGFLILNNKNDIENLFSALDKCRDKVYLRSADGTEEFNLNNAVSRYAAVGELCQDHGDEYEFYCDDRRDEANIMDFFFKLDENAGMDRKCA